MLTLLFVLCCEAADRIGRFFRPGGAMSRRRKSRRQRERDQVARIDGRVVDFISGELAQVEIEAIPADWCRIELRGGPYDGAIFPVPKDQAGNANHWVFLPASAKSECTGLAAYAWYQHRRGSLIADFWQVKIGDPFGDEKS